MTLYLKILDDVWKWLGPSNCAVGVERVLISRRQHQFRMGNEFRATVGEAVSMDPCDPLQASF